MAVLVNPINPEDVLKGNTAYLPIYFFIFFPTAQAELTHIQQPSEAVIFQIPMEILLQQCPQEKGWFSAWPKAGGSLTCHIANWMLIPLGALPLFEVNEISALSKDKEKKNLF